MPHLASTSSCLSHCVSYDRAQDRALRRREQTPVGNALTIHDGEAPRIRWVVDPHVYNLT